MHTVRPFFLCQVATVPKKRVKFSFLLLLLPSGWQIYLPGTALPLRHGLDGFFCGVTLRCVRRDRPRPRPLAGHCCRSPVLVTSYFWDFSPRCGRPDRMLCCSSSSSSSTGGRGGPAVCRVLSLSLGECFSHAPFRWLRRSRRLFALPYISHLFLFRPGCSPGGTTSCAALRVSDGVIHTPPVSGRSALSQHCALLCHCIAGCARKAKNKAPRQDE